MRSLLSIVIVTLRDAARSKLVLALSVVLAALAIALPFALTGDGTPDGQVRITLQYTLCIGMIVLSFASVWMASSSISADVRTRTLQLVRVKPVRMTVLWLGKWLAYLLLDGALLAAFLLVLCGRIALMDGTGGFRRSSHAIPPALPSIEEQTERTYRRAVADADLDRKGKRALRAQIRAQIPYATATLSRGADWHWRFDLPRPVRPGERLWLRCHMDVHSLTRHDVVAECVLRAEGMEASIPLRIGEFSSRELLLPLDAAPLAGATSLLLDIHHAGAEGSGPILIQPRQNLVLLQEAGSFTANLARCYLLLLSILSVLLAVSLSFGALFTFPVAVFCSVCLLLSTLVGRYASLDPDILADPDTEVPEPPVVALAREAAAFSSHALAALSGPALDPAPIARLSAGEAIRAIPLLRSLFSGLLLLPLLFSIVTAIPLSRKELPE